MGKGSTGSRQFGRAATRALLSAAALFLASAVISVPPAGAVPPTFSTVFVPDEIAPGGTSTLRFTIDNTANGTETTALLFTNTLPTGVVVAPTPNASTTCASATWAPTAGSGALSFSGGKVTASSSCVVEVDVTSLKPGAHVNTSSVLTSSQPDTTAATDTLRVAAPPRFNQAFSPRSIDPAGVSTLTFTIDNSANGLEASALAFTDPLPTVPAALVVAPTPNASTTCTGGTLTATAGSGAISYTGGTVPAGSSCTVSVDVTAPTNGTYAAQPVVLASSDGDSSTSTDALLVAPIFVEKTVVEDSIEPGGTVTFKITVRNDGSEDLANVVVDDDLVTDCDRTFTGLAIDETETYTCSLANVTSSLTTAVVVTAQGVTSCVEMEARASAAITVVKVPTNPDVTVPTNPDVTVPTSPVVSVPTSPVPSGPTLALTGASRTVVLAAIGFGVLLTGAALALASSDRRRLFRFRR